MLRYALRSLAIIPLALLAAHFLGYAFGHLVRPIHASRNPLFASGPNPGPLLPTYRDYLPQALRLELGPLPGSSAAEPLIAALGRATLASMGLLGLALTLSVIAGLTLGLLAVRDRPARIAPWLTALTTLGLATPPFFFGVLGIAFVIIFLIYAPGRMVLLPLEGFGWDRHLVLPTLALMLRPTAQIAQVTAGMMVGELSRHYVITARSIGATERRILRRHVLRNALPAMIGTIAASLRGMAGELILVENLFYWPGLGRLIALTIVPANSSLDPEAALFLSPTVLGAVLAVFAALFLLSNLAANLTMRALDPRLR